MRQTYLCQQWAVSFVQKIYAVQSEQGIVKIGISNNPIKRLTSLRTGSAHKMRLVFAADCIGVTAEALERQIHSALAAHRRAGEWFAVEETAAIQAIENVSQKIGCELAPIPTSVGVRFRMSENHPWQQRMRTAGLTQRVLSRLLGRPEITVSKQLRGHFGGAAPKHLTAVIVAWELMSEEQRTAWIAAAEALD